MGSGVTELVCATPKTVHVGGGMLTIVAAEEVSTKNYSNTTFYNPNPNQRLDLRHANITNVLSVAPYIVYFHTHLKQ